MQNFIALLITFSLAMIWLRLNNYVAHRGWISSGLSRKIIHIGTGPIFVLCWIFFDDAYAARYFAAIVPLLITVQFFLIGSGIIKDQSSVDSMSRSGNRKEILKGPLFYGIVFVVMTILFWKDNPFGIISLMMLCGGDGLADVIGSRFGTTRLFWSKKKTWLGSLAMLLGGVVTTILVISIYIAAGIFKQNIFFYAPAIIAIGLIAAFFESLPFEDYDNLVVPVVVTISCLLFLPKG
jgi:phytol kinase